MAGSADEHAARDGRLLSQRAARPAQPEDGMGDDPQLWPAGRPAHCGTPAHAPPCLWLRPRRPRGRHAAHSRLLGTPEYSAHRPVHGDQSGAVCTAVAVSDAPMVWETFRVTDHRLPVICDACNLLFLQARDGCEAI